MLVIISSIRTEASTALHLSAPTQQQLFQPAEILSLGELTS
ncbi:hypothetical protein ACW9HS_32285 [Nocardia gipuzkoensis]|jgi:hypothetical protein